MALSDEQVERYSRQIIVPGVGGLGQERLRGARLLLVAEPPELLPALAYLVGAGVGTVLVASPDPQAVSWRATVEAMAQLNPDVTVVPHGQARCEPDLVLVLAASAALLEVAERICRARRRGSCVFAWLCAPGKIAVVAAAPPCPVRSGGEVLAACDKRGETSGFIAMVAITETVKLAAADRPFTPPPGTHGLLLAFDGYRTRVERLEGSGGGCLLCAKEARDGSRG